MATEFLAVVCFSYLELSGTRYPSANVNLSANIPETIAGVRLRIPNSLHQVRWVTGNIP